MQLTVACLSFTILDLEFWKMASRRFYVAVYIKIRDRKRQKASTSWRFGWRNRSICWKGGLKRCKGIFWCLHQSCCAIMIIFQVLQLCKLNRSFSLLLNLTCKLHTSFKSFLQIRDYIKSLKVAIVRLSNSPSRGQEILKALEPVWVQDLQAYASVTLLLCCNQVIGCEGCLLRYLQSEDSEGQSCPLCRAVDPTICPYPWYGFCPCDTC